MAEVDKPIWLSFKRDGGGLAIIPWDEIGIISTLVTNKGTQEEPDLVIDESKSLVHVKSINTSIVVLHPAEEVLCWLGDVEYVSPEEDEQS